MKITRDNYEQYFLDHAEGRLSSALERELADFLEANPDLRDVLDSYDASPLPPDDLTNENLRRRLKKRVTPTKHIGETNIDEWLIRDLEGMLTVDEQTELESFISDNPAFEYDRKLFGLTIQNPDPSITYKGKGKLKKRGVLVSMTRIGWIATAAAAILLLLTIVRFWPESVMEEVIVKETPSQNKEMPSQMKETPSALAEMPSQPNETPSALMETPSQNKETPSHRAQMESRLIEMESQFLTPLQARSIDIDQSPVSLQASLNYHPLPENIMPEAEEKGLLASVVSNLFGKARDAFRENPTLERLSDADLNLWSIAQAGVNGYNRISDRDLALYIHKDRDGNVLSYALVEQDKLLLSKDLDKE